MLRNAVERAFGVLKKQFPVLKKPLEHKFDTQVKLVQALCILHNYILDASGGRDWFAQLPDEDLDLETDLVRDRGEGEVQFQSSARTTRELKEQAARKRDQIARKMWRKYKREQVNRICGN